MYRQHGKRLLDLAICVPFMIAMAPLAALVATLVYAAFGRPVLFRQQRAGRDGTIFQVAKFRSMTDERDADGELLPDEFRLTTFGKWLRKLGLDELPQLWNVVRGDMSIVGPRPLLARYLDRYTPEQARRHEVTPGITGWAQVNGRNALSWEDKFRHDIWYVDNQSCWLDLKIMLMTVGCVFRGREASMANHATMPEFMGSAIEATDHGHQPTEKA